MRESIVFHRDVAGLHAHVDREILPEELGGAAGPFDNGECLDALEAMDRDGAFRQRQALNNNSNV